MNRFDMHFRTMFVLALAMLFFRGLSSAQSTNIGDYVGAYFDESHPRGGLSVQATATGYGLSFCQDMILNTCAHVNVDKSLSSTFEFQPATGDHGGNVMGFTAKVVQEGSETLIQVTTKEGTIWKFSPR